MTRYLLLEFHGTFGHCHKVMASKRGTLQILSRLSPFQNLKKLVLFGCQAYLLNWWKIGPQAGLSASPEALRRKGSLAKVAAFKISV